MEANLDYLCAKYGQEIPQSKDDEKLIQKALGVLQEDGLFAFVIFLESKKDENIADNILKKSEKLLEEAGVLKNLRGNLREEILEITRDVDKMFFAKEIIEQAMIYALFRAKALPKKVQ